MAEESLDIEELYAFAIDLSKRAGQILLDAAEKRRASQSIAGAGGIIASVNKLNSVDVVTETDERLCPVLPITVGRP
jgi:myo-inositol-1(or 4)-monophosphatase